MNEADEMLAWLEGGRDFALAVVTKTWSSAPRPAGAMMAVALDGQVIGSLSGGCVESAVHELALEVLRNGRAASAHYGTSDAEAFAVGLACGGQIDVLVTPVLGPDTVSQLRIYLEAVSGSRAAALALELPGVTEGDGADLGGASRILAIDAEGTAHGNFSHERLTEHISMDARAMIADGATGILEYDETGRRLGSGTRVFVTTSTPPPRLLIFGAIDYAAALAELGRFLGYRVTVCDARRVFTTSERFPAAHEVVVSWPHRYFAAEDAAGRIDASTVVAVLTHDLKFDVPVLLEAVRSAADYVGALGSRRTHAQRTEALLDAGASEEEIARIHGPIGLDLGARSPEATAISIFAEVLVERSRGTGASLRATTGAIHR
ncbi:XdhC family protein [Brevibacterium linens]|jgi:xanthine dehydrogenase accessory factor|uniref:XshC-Cox1-family protein n=1 Tax=Brevibacterium linens TaxID=1703 RepID=A0A0B9AK01_BRELN|nr:XdhC/CoxI family protein [Brevibacterium linens]KHS51074.1 XshC-Cox1-family protein [Brevibacterium linens]